MDRKTKWGSQWQGHTLQGLTRQGLSLPETYPFGEYQREPELPIQPAWPATLSTLPVLPVEVQGEGSLTLYPFSQQIWSAFLS